MSDKRFEVPAELDQKTGGELLEAVRREALESGDTVVLDVSQTASMNSLGGAWLIELADHVRGRNAEFRFEGQHGSIAEFLEMLEPGLAPRESKRTVPENWVQRLGGVTIDFFTEAGQVANLIIDALYWTFIALWDGRGFRWGLFLDELHEMGVRAIRINFLMNFLLGLIIAMLSAAQLEDFGAVIFVADLVVIAFARELAAVMTAVVVSSRTGAAIAAELATMQVQEEIDALRGMGLNVNQFLVAPKLLALLVAMPCLVAIGMVAGILGGSLWGVAVMGIERRAWTRELMAAAEFGDVFQGMAKCVLFAFVIVIIGCHNGLRVRGGSRGVGLMTTRAVVWDIFAIITIDMVFAALFYYVF